MRLAAAGGGDVRCGSSAGAGLADAAGNANTTGVRSRINLQGTLATIAGIASEVQENVMSDHDPDEECQS